MKLARVVIWLVFFGPVVKYKQSGKSTLDKKGAELVLKGAELNHPSKHLTRKDIISQGRVFQVANLIRAHFNETIQKE